MSDQPAYPPSLSAEQLHQRIAELEAENAALRERIAAYQDTEQRLHISEERFRAVFDASPDALVLQSYPDWPDKPMRFIDCNATVCAIIGASREELIDKPIALFNPHPLTLDEELSYADHVRAGERVVIETDVLLADGSHLISEVLSTHISVAGQEMVLGIGRDITQRKEVEAKIRFQSKLLESVGQAIIAVDLAGTIIYWNKAAEQLLGWSAAEMLGYPGRQQAEQTTLSEDFNAVLTTLLEHGFWAGEMLQQRRDRSTFPAYVSSSFFLDDAGKRVGIISSITDLTSLKQAEERLSLLNNELELRVAERTKELAAANRMFELLNHSLARSHDLLATILNKLSDGIALLDDTGNLLVVNEALARLVGSAAEPLTGQPWANLGLAKLDISTATQCQMTYSGPQGQLVMLEIQSDLITNSSPDLNLLLVKVTDITERLHIETITLQNERLAASGRLAEVIAHEVNTPLQAMQNLVYLAQVSPKEQSSRYLTLVHDEIRRVSATLKRMLDLNRGASDTWEMLDCNALIERMLMLTEMLLLSRHITIVRDLSANLLQVWGNADSLCQVLLNLIINASDAMPQGGTLTMRTMLRIISANGLANELSLSDEADTTDLRMIIEVTDSGEGIAPEILPSIFQPFFTTKAVGAGTGLGLSISQRIILEHGGRIWAASQIGHGTTLTVELPIHHG